MEVRSEDDIRALPPLLQEHVRQVLRAGGKVWFGREGEAAPGTEPVEGPEQKTNPAAGNS